MITEEEVIHVANLAKLELKQEEVKKFRKEFAKILEYFSILDEVGEDVEPTYHVLPLKNVFREDVPKKPLPRELVLMNAKHVEDGYFKGPKIMED
ncbi:Asp-tRNA(Asn)/Glu-tRNA(Gln) amidotransferase subunit GatC [Archaeoglobus sp.]